jgi:hypothetical protein
MIEAHGVLLEVGPEALHLTQIFRQCPVLSFVLMILGGKKQAMTLIPTYV